MLNFVISLFLGMLPEVLYFTLFLDFTLKIKDKKILLFVLLAIGYIVLIMICRYEFIFYLAYIVYSYLILKLLYNSHIIDLFVYSLSFSYLMVLSYLTATLIGNYTLAYILDRVLLFVPFIFNNKFNVYYNKYRYLWNRHNNSKIKSITLRNSSLLFVNIMILLINSITIVSMMMFTNKV